MLMEYAKGLLSRDLIHMRWQYEMVTCLWREKKKLEEGYGKIDFLNAELGEGVAVMREIKRALDPENIMNPGKIVQM